MSEAFLIKLQVLRTAILVKRDSCKICKNFKNTLGMIPIWCPWKLSNFQDHQPPLSIYFQNSSTLWTWTSNFKRAPPLQMITNQLKENIIQEWLLYVIKSFFQVDFRFQYQLFHLVWLSYDFFKFNWSLSICFFVACLYSCVINCLNTSRNVFHL